jgi:hypothetical protein
MKANAYRKVTIAAIARKVFAFIISSFGLGKREMSIYFINTNCDPKIRGNLRVPKNYIYSALAYRQKFDIIENVFTGGRNMPSPG